MSQLLYLSKRLDRIIVEGPQNTDFASALNAIIPRYDRKRYTGIWDISDRWFPLIKVAAETYYVHFSCGVVASECRKPNPDWHTQWRAYLRGRWGEPLEIDEESNGSPARSRLFVTADAPPEVVTAAYRALAKLHHPDKEGGDEETFKELDRAYREVKDGY
jgi:hypothetical protein